MAAASFRPATGSIPTQPGVYRFRDARGRVIYVGKAKNLRARLSSYFQDIGNLHARTATMVTTAAGVDWTVVNTEVEALQLEYSWIKEFDPRFNVKYRDDKSYPWLAVTVGDEFPRVMVGRGAKRKGTRYFGPYSHAWAIRETVDILLRVFPMRSCSNGVFKRSGQIGRPCLLGYIDKCSAPCVGNISADDHRAIVDDFCDFMAGQTRPFVRRIEREMYAASDREDFEKAARLRDDLGAMERALEKQAVVLGDGSDVDVIALAEDPLEVAVQVFYVRGGRIRGQRGWVADRVEEGGTPDLVEDFLLQLYAGDSDSIPQGDPGPRAAPGRRRRSSSSSATCAAAGCRSGCRSAATRRRSRRPSPATREGRWRCTRPSGPATSPPATGRWRRSSRRSSSTTYPSASSATTSPTSRAPRWWPRWWSSRTAWPARASTAASSSRGSTARTTSPRCTR